MPHSEIVAAAAAEVVGMAIPTNHLWASPHKNWVMILRRAGWPMESHVIDLEQHEHRGLRAGQRTGAAPQPVVCVPEPWLRELARRLNLAWRDACRRTVDTTR